MLDENGPIPTQRRLTSEVEYHQALDEVLLHARRHVLIFDRTLDHRWDRPMRLDALRRLCLGSSQNTLRIALHDPESMVRNTPRLRELLKTSAHVMTVHRTRDEALRAEDPLVIVDGRHFVHRFHFDAARGLLAINDPEATQSLLQRFEQIWGASESGISGTTLGL